MADACRKLVSKAGRNRGTIKPLSRAARRRRMEIRRVKFFGHGTGHPTKLCSDSKRRKLLGSCEVGTATAAGSSCREENRADIERSEGVMLPKDSRATLSGPVDIEVLDEHPRYGVSSVCGRRREMEDTFAIHPSFFSQDDLGLHYFGVYDGHGCSHVAVRCRERMHELVKEELLRRNGPCGNWKAVMKRSFWRMEEEVMAWNTESCAEEASCRCELQSPECDAVGSTAVVAIVAPDKIIVANCGDSRAVLSRKGKAFPLSSDHKPDRPDELDRIEAAGGCVIYWDGPRVLGVLAMSRAIGDDYLKPYVSWEPEVTVIDRTVDDDCLIIASDGLWDSVSNETACRVACMCLKGKSHAPPSEFESSMTSTCRREAEGSDKACSDASLMLTKLALARHSTDNVSVVVVDLRRSQGQGHLIIK